eukprot:gene4797-biopygen3281
MCGIPSFRHSHTRLSCHALDVKPNGKLRPITPESVWLKLPSIVTFAKLPLTARTAFTPYQFGVWGDAAVAVKKIRTAQEDPQNDTLVALDGTNAYNAVSRRDILEAVYSNDLYRPIWGLATLALGCPGHLHLYAHGESVGSLRSTAGIRQGMVLGPLLFAAGLHRVLDPFRARHPRVTTVAYLDDITLVGPHAATQAALEDLIPALKTFGYTANVAKSTAIQWGDHPHLEIQGTSIPRAQGPVKILGAGFGTTPQNDMSQWLLDIARKEDPFFERLVKPNAALRLQGRILLLRISALPRLQHLLRTHRPAELHDAAASFDARVQGAFMHLMGLEGPWDDLPIGYLMSQLAEHLVRQNYLQVKAVYKDVEGL